MNALIKVPENKNIILDSMINLYLDPLKIYIPILKKEKFKLNTYIYKNTYFDSFISSVSGKITGSKKVLVNNKFLPSLEITNDFKENINYKIGKRKVKNKDEFLTLLNEFHLDDILKKIENREIKNLVIKAVDYDIYAYNELMILASYPTKVCDTINEIGKLLGNMDATIAIKDTSFKAIKNLKSIIGTYSNIRIKLLNDYYVMSYDEFICKELNMEEKDTLVLSINDIYNIYNALLKGSIINEVFITISGDAIEKSMVVKTRLGTSIEELLNKLIKIVRDDYNIFINGPIKGIKVDDINNYIVTKDIKCIVINKKESIEISDCINCGLCYKVCPFNINVIKCYNNKKKNKNCNGCGLCNYICPSNIDLKSRVYGGNNE